MHCSCSIFCCPSNCHTAVSPWFSICTLITLLTFFVPSLQFAILNSFVAEHVAQIYLADFLLPIVMASIIGCDKQIHRLLCDYFLQMHAILCPNTGHSLLSSWQVSGGIMIIDRQLSFGSRPARATCFQVIQETSQAHPCSIHGWS